ncbi:hypothetical protein D9M71_743440 [compost metagenome]
MIRDRQPAHDVGVVLGGLAIGLGGAGLGVPQFRQGVDLGLLLVALLTQLVQRFLSLL